MDHLLPLLLLVRLLLVVAFLEVVLHLLPLPLLLPAKSKFKVYKSYPTCLKQRFNILKSRSYFLLWSLSVISSSSVAYCVN